MKRLTFLFLMSMFVMAMSAQTFGGEISRKRNKAHNTPSATYERISRDVDGITLGLSTKQDVIRQLKNRGRKYDINEPIDDYTVIISNGKATFQGVTWAAIAYKILNNKVYQISFLGRGGDDAGSTNDVVDYVKLRDYYASIYGKYHKSYTEGEHFSDKITYIFITGAKPQKELVLTFADVKIYDYLTQ